MSNFPRSDWEFFEKWKTDLYQDRKLKMQLQLIGIASQKLNPFWDEKKMQQRRTAISKALSLFSEDESNELIADSRNHLICALTLLDESVLPFVFTGESSSSRGRRSYPRILSHKIVILIDGAKGDSKKFDVLWRYFAPKGEFSKWIDAKSQGTLSGPSRKDEFLDKTKWVKELKRTHQSALDRKSIPTK